ncbi:hypothetical protein [Cytobacillus oceanisediminis]|uniref:hypothetical protein n=1 Tax=Cytobacillus oceanisediminis TaxID=665099 RepID=UPI0015872AF0|nr:hypothetical protein [Cytobacillus oceanisediminis]
MKMAIRIVTAPNTLFLFKILPPIQNNSYSHSSRFTANSIVKVGVLPPASSMI